MSHDPYLDDGYFGSESDEREDPGYMPHDARAEQSVLGGMLLSQGVIDDVAEELAGASDFYRPAHERIYDAIHALHTRGEPVDTVTVGDEMTTAGTLRAAGGHAYLHDLIQATPTAANASYYARIVAEHAIRRRIVLAGRQITALGQTDPAQVPIDDAIARFEEIATSVDRPDREDVPHATAVYDAIDALEDPPGLATPWQRLTETIAGWKPQCLYYVGARPSIGKSVIGVHAALDVARRGKTAMIFSLEMGRTDLYHRLLSSIGEVDMGRIQHRRLTQDDYSALSKAAAHLAKLPLVIDDRAALSVAQIRAKVKAEQRRSEVGLIVIDYLQLIAPPAGAPRNDRRVQVDSISRSLQALTKDSRVPVLALTQLNRASEGRADKMPTLADLREAGGQEQDADVVMLLHREKADDPATLKVGIGKNRHGPLAFFDLRFEGQYARAIDPPWSPTSCIA